MARNQNEDPRAATAVDLRIGALIRARRLELGMSQTVLAEAVGVTFQQIQKYEKGINRVSASTLMDVATALDARVSDLLPAASDGEADGRAADDARDVLEYLPRLNDEGRRVVAFIARTLCGDARYRAVKQRRED
jgi:transcriptional regulator with XRE-family HTH domain